MKLTFATIAAIAICLFSLIARSQAIRQERAYLEQERLALAAIDNHLRAKLPKLTNR
jgi:hypothetical protein